MEDNKPELDFKERNNFPKEASFQNLKDESKPLDLKEKTFYEKEYKQNEIHTKRAIAVSKADDIFELRKKGWTIREIAYKYEVNAFTIQKILKREIHRINNKLGETVDDLRQLQLERLDFMLKSLWPLMEKGNANAIEKGLSIMERQAKLMGLDAPEKKQIDITVDMPTEEVLENARRLGLEIPKGYDIQAGVIMDAEYKVIEAISNETTEGKTEGETQGT